MFPAATSIIKRGLEIQGNPKGLPDVAPAGAKPRESVQGHRDVMKREIDSLGAAADRYKNMCGGGPPPAPGAEVSTSRSSASINTNVVKAAAVVVVAGAILLAPETGGASLLALAY